MNQERPHFIRGEERLSLLGYGKRCNTFETPDKRYVIKIVREVDELQEAQNFSNKLREQYGLLKEYMGEYVLDTQFVIGSTTHREVGILLFSLKLLGFLSILQSKGDQKKIVQNRL